jgi:hypothetical protein
MKKQHMGQNLPAGCCGELKGRMLWKRKQLCQEGGKGIKDLDSRQPLYLRIEGTVNGIRVWSS